MTFMLDNNLPPQFAVILQMLDLDVCHLRDHFAANTDDAVWIPEAAKHGWVVVTCDLRIRKRAQERQAYKQAGAVVVGLFPGFSRIPTLRGKLLWLLRRWDDIEQAVRGARPGTFLLVSQRGKIERL
jgi:hypothetical protein